MQKRRDITTIRVRRETKSQLKSLGSKGQTYDAIISKLMETVEYEEFMEKQYQRLREKSKFVPLDKTVIDKFERELKGCVKGSKIPPDKLREIWGIYHAHD